MILQQFFRKYLLIITISRICNRCWFNSMVPLRLVKNISFKTERLDCYKQVDLMVIIRNEFNSIFVISNNIANPKCNKHQLNVIYQVLGHELLIRFIVK